MRPRLFTLSRRQAQVLCALVDGKSTRVMAAEMDVSYRTARTYRATVWRKLKGAA